MHTKLSVAGALSVAAAVVTGVAAAGHTAAQQRIAITSASGNSATFVLTPLTSGPHRARLGNGDGLLQEPGASSSETGRRSRSTTRSGRSSANAERSPGAGRIEWVDPGKGYYVGTGTWKIVRGTGSYAHLEVTDVLR